MLTICALGTFGCAATTIQVPRLKPAEVNLGPVKKVAIGTIEGDGGEDISDKLTESIMSTGRYEVLDRKHLAEITREKQIAVDDPGAAYGHVLGAAALIFGRVTRNGMEQTVTADQQVCLQGRNSVPCTTYTRVGNHAVSVSFKVVDAATGKVLLTKMVNGGASAKREVQVLDVKATNPQVVATIIPPFPDPETFREAAIGAVVTAFMRMIAPFSVSVSVVLYEQDSQASKIGVNAARAGDWASAIENFKSALRTAAEVNDLEVQARAYYNLGVALGYSGSYDEGIRLIRKAMTLKSDDVFAEEIRKIQGFKADDARLKAQGD